ncbi:MAG: C_GCAxxG_C_C family protein [Marinilabiliaceae bacterium]|nr:C_GCAxxG_C_C family protein [Marinilabiliaceae bacterium]
MSKSSEERIEEAVRNFYKGYNCSQSICTAWADEYGLTEEQMAKLSSCFGGGIGRMRKTCGAACGMFILLGLKEGNSVPGDKDAKAANYAVVQRLAREFAKRNGGSIECSELLKMGGVATTTHYQPDERTAQYYAKRPCPHIIEEAARIWAEYESGNLRDDE